MSFPAIRNIGYSSRVIIVVIGIFILPAFAPPLYAATYYVDATNGKDSNTGFLETMAWKTIAKVNASRFSPGDQILFKRGKVWRETLLVPSSGTPGKPIVFSAYGSGNKPTIVGSDAITFWKNIGGNVWNATVTTEPSVVWFNGTTGIKETAKANLNTSTEWFWAGNVLSVYSATSPTNIEVASRKSSIIASGHSYLKFSNLNLINNGNVNSGAGIVLGSGSSEIEVDACDFSQADAGHIGIWGTASGTITISNSTFAYSGLGHYIGAGSAIDVTTITNPLVIVEKSRFTHVGDWAGSGYHDHGIYFKGGRLIWRYNYQYNGGKETGASVKISSWGSGSAQDRCEIYYNIISSGGGVQTWGVLSEAGSGHKVYNNVFYGVGTGVWQAGANGPTVAGGKGIEVKNNVFHTTTYRFVKATATEGFISDYNTFYNGPTTPFMWGNTNSQDANWQAGTGLDRNSKYADPKFMDPLNDDFRLEPSSPSIGAGQDVGLRKDFNSTAVPQGTGVDMGAYQFKKIIEAPHGVRIAP